MNNLYKKILTILSSRYFLIFIVGLFVFQALWIAFSFRYPMIYDESYHFGVISYFSNQWLPWITNQPAGLDVYGALERQPYLLYHYIMSFPLRFVAAFTENIAAQVISLRIINIAIFTAGILVFVELFNKMRIKPIFRNISLLIFILLPITPFVAAHINYDNLIFLLSALVFLFGLKIINAQRLNWQYYAYILIIGLIGCLVKISFFPTAAAAISFLVIRAFLKYRKKTIKEFGYSFRKTKLYISLPIITVLIGAGFLFMERFAVNIIEFGSVTPSCQKQLNEERCSRNFIQKRAEDLKKKSKEIVPHQQPEYISVWSSDMIKTLTVSGTFIPGYGPELSKPAPVHYLAVFWMTLFAVAAFLYSLDKIKKTKGFLFLSSIVLFYISTLLYLNYSDYEIYRQFLAIQGRYLLPVLPIILLFFILGLNNVFKKIYFLKLPALIIFMAFFLNGAGLSTHLIQSNEHWNWDSKQIRDINTNARKTIKPFVQKWWYER